MNRKIPNHKQWKKLREYDLTSAFKSLTKVEIKDNESLNDYLQRIEETSTIQIPCAFADLIVLQSRVACFASDPKLKEFDNILVGLAVENYRNTPILVMDLYMSGANALYLCMTTTDIVTVFTKWVSLARPGKIHVFEIKDDPETITHLILAPLSCFMQDVE